MDPTVVADVVEAPPNGGHTTRLFECVQEQDGSKDDQQEVEREKQPLDCGGGHVPKRHAPDVQGDDNRRDVDERHGPFGWDTKAYQEDTTEKDG